MSRRLGPKTARYYVEDAELAEGNVGEKILSKADQVFALRPAGDEHEPPRIGIFEGAELAFLVGGEQLLVDELYDAVGSKLEDYFGLDAEELMQAGEKVEIRRSRAWDGLWVEVDEPARFSDRLDLLSELEEPIDIELGDR